MKEEHDPNIAKGEQKRRVSDTFGKARSAAKSVKVKAMHTVKDGDTSQSLGERIKAQFQSRKGYADLAHAKYGGEYRLFTNVEIEQFKQLLDGAQNATSPVTTQMSILSAMFESAGPATSRAMKTSRIG